LEYPFRIWPTDIILFIRGKMNEVYFWNKLIMKELGF